MWNLIIDGRVREQFQDKPVFHPDLLLVEGDAALGDDCDGENFTSHIEPEPDRIAAIKSAAGAVILGRYPHLTWKSEPDKGHTNAINKALALARGEVICWLNTDDQYLPGTFEIVRRVFSSTSSTFSAASTTASVSAFAYRARTPCSIETKNASSCTASYSLMSGSVGGNKPPDASIHERNTVTRAPRDPNSRHDKSALNSKLDIDYPFRVIMFTIRANAP